MGGSKGEGLDTGLAAPPYKHDLSIKLVLNLHYLALFDLILDSSLPRDDHLGLLFHV